MNKIKQFFGDRDFWRATLRLAPAIAFQNLLISSFALVDTVMVSQLGSTALSAVGMAGQWSWLFNMFLFGTASGTAMFLSQYWGVRDRAGIHRATGYCFVGSAGFLLFFFTIAVAAPEFVITLFNKDPEIVRCGSAYLRIAVWSYPAIALNSVLSNTLRATEHVRMPMLVSLFTTLCNAGCNAALIFGLGPFPEMGVEGAALATVISSWAGPLLLLIISLCQKNILHAPLRAYFAFTKSQTAAFVRRVVPVVCNEGLWGIGTWVISLIYANTGAEIYGGVTILRSCENVAFAFVQGLGAACCVMTGKAIGSGQIKRAVQDARRFSLLVPLFSLCIGGVAILLREPLIGLFNISGNQSALTLDTARIIMLIWGLELCIRNIPYIQVVGIFRSGGDTFTAALFDIVSLWVLAIPTALISSLCGAPFALVFALTYIAEDWPKGVLCILHHRRYRWIKPVTEEGRAALAEWQAELAAQRAAR